MVSFLEGEGQNFYFRSLDMVGEVSGGAFNSNADLFSRDNFLRVVKAIKYSLADIFNDAFELYRVTFITEICTSFISGIGRKKSPISSKDFI